MTVTVCVYVYVEMIFSQVGKLEGEVGVQHQQLGHVTAHRDALQEQLKSTTMQLTKVESQLSMEKANSASFQVGVLCAIVIRTG